VTLKCVDKFAYLSSVITNVGEVKADVNTRLAKTATVFRRLENMWTSSSLSLKTKLQLYSAEVVSTDIYASETWKSTVWIHNKLDVFHQKNLCKF